MNYTVIAFSTMAAIAAGFAFATMARELPFKLRLSNQTGDSSLGRNSVNWLAATAATGAVLICFVLA